jgi:hypothetical protein
MYKIINLIRLWACRHKSHEISSCPFTRNTYVICQKCGKYLSIYPTKDVA